MVKVMGIVGMNMVGLTPQSEASHQHACLARRRQFWHSGYAIPLNRS